MRPLQLKFKPSISIHLASSQLRQCHRFFSAVLPLLLLLLLLVGAGVGNCQASNAEIVANLGDAAKGVANIYARADEKDSVGSSVGGHFPIFLQSTEEENWSRQCRRRCKICPAHCCENHLI